MNEYHTSLINIGIIDNYQLKRSPTNCDCKMNLDFLYRIQIHMENKSIKLGEACYCVIDKCVVDDM